jgi:hypothetical protein
MSARAVPCGVPAIKRNLVSGWKQSAGSCARANRAGISHTRSNSQNHVYKFKARSAPQPCHEKYQGVLHYFAHVDPAQTSHNPVLASDG